jgi:hypothetical protein
MAVIDYSAFEYRIYDDRLWLICRGCANGICSMHAMYNPDEPDSEDNAISTFDEMRGDDINGAITKHIAACAQAEAWQMKDDSTITDEFKEPEM